MRAEDNEHKRKFRRWPPRVKRRRPADTHGAPGRHSTPAPAEPMPAPMKPEPRAGEARRAGHEVPVRVRPRRRTLDSN